MKIFENIKIIAIDVDGTLTDGIYQIFEDGSFSKTFYTRDFDAVAQCLKHGFKVVIITTSHDEVILSQIERIRKTSSMATLWERWIVDKSLIVINKSGNKKSRMTNLLIDEGFGWDNLAYIGDAEGDFECLKLADFSGCPSDAIEEVKGIAHYVSDFSGGRGAVYDFCKYILKKRRNSENIES